MTDRRSVLRGLLLAAVTRCVQAAPPALVGASGRARWLLEGEAALMRGEADQAMQAFEQAGAMGHDPAIELGLVRAAMQAGRYRQAQGFAAHTAGEHANDAACVAMHVWLLQLGGQAALAAQVVEQAKPLLLAEGRAMLDAVMRQWQRGWPHAGDALRQAPLRLAPYAHGEPLPTQAQAVCSGTLMMGADRVQRVIVPDVVDTMATMASRWWVRNGLGQTVAAVWDRAHDDDHADAPAQAEAAPPVRLLRLLGASLPGQAVLAERDAFPGSPAYACAYANARLDAHAAEAQGTHATASEAAQALASWPLMRMGFAGRVDAKEGRLLGVDGPHGPWSQSNGARNALGGPVWNAKGQLIGVALPGANGSGPDRMWPVSAMRQSGWFWTPPSEAAMSPMPAPMPLDALYEQSMQLCVQVIAAN